MLYADGRTVSKNTYYATPQVFLIYIFQFVSSEYLFLSLFPWNPVIRNQLLPIYLFTQIHWSITGQSDIIL